MVVVCFFANMISEENGKFLRKVAAELVAQHGQRLSDVVVILPSRRSKYFLLHEISSLLMKSYWAPRCFIMPELVGLLTGSKLAGEMELLCMLYEVHRKISKSPEDIHAFFRWGKLLLRDFHDVDASLTDPTSLFSDLRDIREIENWSFNNQELSEGQKSFLRFWSEIGELYQSFSHEQQQRGVLSYQAAVKLLVGKNELNVSALDTESIVFVGMSAFSKAEEKLVFKLMDVISCQVIQDLDEFYLNEPMHEAGLLANKSGLPVHQFKGRYFNEIPKSVKLCECSTSTAEVLALVQDLKSFSPEVLSQSAIILADTSSLELFLDAFEKGNLEVHVALGLSLRPHAYWRWLNVLIRIHNSKSKRGVHFRDLMEVMNILSSDERDASTIGRIGSSNLVYYSPKVLDEVLENFTHRSLLLNLCNRKQVPLDFLDVLNEALLLFPSDDAMSAAAVAALSRVVTRLRDLVVKHDYFNDWPAFGLLFHELSGDESIRFEGEPVNGLQILDMVESRALDFETIFILGANEDHLPGKGDYQSMIPFDLRKFHNLPMPEDRDAMFAYNFYRLIQRSSNLNFYYASVSSDFRGTERSRYITQLEHDLPRFNSQNVLSYSKRRIAELSVGTQQMIADSFSQNRLDELFASGISPSAINKFINCPLDFYYRYILGLGEDDAPEENMSVADFGTLIHDVLERFYESYLQQYPLEKDFDELIANVGAHLSIALEKRKNIQHTESGYNFLALRIAEKMIKQYANHEKLRLKKLRDEGIQPTVLAVESSLTKVIDHQNYDWPKPVVLRGKADRIDLNAGRYLIVDYKTGKVDAKNVILKEDVSELFSEPENGKQLQLATYILMHASSGIPLENIDAGFYSFRKYRSGYQVLQSDDMDIANYIPEFEKAFMDWVKSVYETKVFEHRMESKHCQFCR